MAFSSALEASIVALLFNATVDPASPSFFSNAGSATNIYVSLHTGNPAGGTQTTNEAAYPNYARVAVARTSGGWTCAGGVATLVAAATFPTAGTMGGSETETYAAIGYGSGLTAGVIIASALLSANIVVTTGVQPQLTTSTTFTLT